MTRLIKLLVTTILGGMSVPVLAQQWGSYPHDHMGTAGGWFMGGIFMLILLGAIVAIVVLVARQSNGLMRGTQADKQKSENPIDVLKVRYAKGEIDHEEFELRRKALES